MKNDDAERAPVLGTPVAAAGGASSGGGGGSRAATARELLILAWCAVLIVLAYFAGRLANFVAHMGSHHATDGVGACESAALCTGSYAPRALCAGGWRDEVA